MDSTFLYLVSFTFEVLILTAAKDASDYLNYCPDAVYHKKVPGPEPELFGECAPWKSRACCNSNSTVTFHNKSTWLNFNWNHCPNRTMSDKCKTRFLQDLCFYECSPNTGPWIQKVSMKIRNERPMNVPLCNSTCYKWWNDCQNEYTCLNNWGKGFNWISGTNQCPASAVCRPFTEVFKDATTFCNQIWDFAWQVVPDSEPCMKLQFNGSNPNDAVAQQKARQLANRTNSKNADISVISLVAVLIIMLTV
ncbi:hypothetical protein ACJMK2_032316 [Sinanodonta woodiana]|uniref:Folate receptor-like domain-containing protein n=1 Tax=Sinanodonta woodiana TaxID=1069815 RepID=A0ABD3X1C7_SINWO